MIRKNTNLPVLWDSHRVVLISGVALLIPLIVLMIGRGLAMITSLGLMVVLALVWQLLFTKLQQRSFSWDCLNTALLFVMLVPENTPYWQQALALSLGIVMGDLIFGERGRSFLNPVAVGLAFLLFSFPADLPATSNLTVSIAAIFSGVLLLLTGLLSWRIVVSFLVLTTLFVTLLTEPANLLLLLSSSLILGLVFLIGDPVAAASTNVGRWIYGALAAVLVVILGANGAGAGSLASMVFAALLLSIFAPLIDQVIIWANVRRRQRRQV